LIHARETGGKVLCRFTTGEIWTVWIEHCRGACRPQSTSSTRIPALLGRIHHDEAVDKNHRVLHQVRAASGKRIVIAEFGCPAPATTCAKPDNERIQSKESVREDYTHTTTPTIHKLT